MLQAFSFAAVFSCALFAGACTPDVSRITLWNTLSAIGMAVFIFKSTWRARSVLRTD
jgi:Flp pilus assembly protein protease CpaA